MITEYPTINYVDLEFYRPDVGFIVGKSKIGSTVLKPASGGYKWVSYIGKATQISVTRGGKVSGVDFNAEVGTLSVTLINSGNPLDQPNIKPNVPVRLRHISTGVVMFTGSIVDINTSHQFDKRNGTFTDFVTITAVDAAQALANTTRYGVLIEPQTFAERVATLSQSTTVPFGPGPEVYNYRLGATVYEGPLSEHLDLACNSVGARWWVDNMGSVQFAWAPVNVQDNNGNVVAYFTDVVNDPNPRSVALNYIDIETGWDTRVMVNDLNLSQHGTKADDDGNTVADDITQNYKYPQSVIDYGARSGTVDVSLNDTTDMFNRANDILGRYSVPSSRVTRLRWNAQERQERAWYLDISRLISVKFRDIDNQIYRIVKINHEITPDRWIITLDVTKGK